MYKRVYEVKMCSCYFRVTLSKQQGEAVQGLVGKNKLRLNIHELIQFILNGKANKNEYIAVMVSAAIVNFLSSS